MRIEVSNQPVRLELVSAWFKSSRSTELARRDIYDGLTSWRIWWLLAWQDLRARYRRSVIGPLWLTVSTAALIGGMGLVFSTLFKMDLREYLPFLAVGIILWQLISTLLVESTTAFIQAESIIKSMNLPYSIHVLRVITRNVLILFHNLTVLVVVWIVFQIDVGFTTLLFIPGIVLIILNGMWMGILFGTLGTRYRDIQQSIANVAQIIFFLTPIMWPLKQLGERGYIATYNPLYHVIEVVREPLLGNVPELTSYIVVTAMAVIGWITAYLFFCRYRRRITYWL
ncbi:MAG: ABC transporter permease [Alphaproteobacteria bacterium]